MPSLRLDRKTLASFLPDHQSIVAFEQMFKSVEQALPDNLEAATSLAYAASALANLAVSMLAQQSDQLEQVTLLPAAVPVVPHDEYYPATPVGTLGQQNADAVEITGGSIDGVSIGAAVPGSGAFTTLTATGAVSLSPANLNVVISPTGTGLVTIGPATLGAMNNVAIGGTTAAAAAVTTLTASAAVTLSPANANVVLSPTGTGIVTISPATVGSMNRVNIGATVAGTGAFTTLSAAATSVTTLSATDQVVGTKTYSAGPAIRASSAGTNLSSSFASTNSDASNYLVGYSGDSGDPAPALFWRDTAELRLGTATSYLAAGFTTRVTIGIAGLKSVAGFGCNGKTPQTAAASGGAMDATAAINIAPYGFTTAAQADSIATKLNTIQAALIANGIMS